MGLIKYRKENKEKEIKEPIKITIKEKNDEVTFLNRNFNLIALFLGIEYRTKFIETETSFTIKNSKKTVNKKNLKLKFIKVFL